ncbi:hypothetical protein PV04_09421 [Phialophora macrospora]|uniref:4Fe-4S ferredoxin-type domain-containing protein n=1 Tax=Phialophora macrospora TaxID=1851006 RepID=A0A0D2DQM4_9EURO|nr:hypothetical protein PV04_09421 [Phialophora macrospora]
MPSTSLLLLTCVMILGAIGPADAYQKLPLRHLSKRQEEYEPDPTTCTGSGTTCEEVCGLGYISCGDPNTSPWCYNPDIGEPCCEPASPTPWICYAGDFCLVQGFCCPSGADASECAYNFSVTLPATYSASTPIVPFTSTPFLTTTDGTVFDSSPTTTATATDSAATAAEVDPATGAANANNVMDTGTGVFYGLLVFVFNLLL